MSATKFFFAHCPAQIIGVTGTNSDLCAAMIQRILEHAGVTAWLGGNVGGPPLAFLSELSPDHFVVLSLSSFQLIDITQSPEISIILRIEGLDLKYHRDISEYCEAKKGIVRFQSASDIAVFNPHDTRSVEVAAASPGRLQPYLDPPYGHVRENRLCFGNEYLLELSEVTDLGDAAPEAAAAAVTAVRNIVPETEAVRSGLRSVRLPAKPLT